jgi:hypothetical protein
MSIFSCCTNVSGRQTPEKQNRIKADKRIHLLFSEKDKPARPGTGRKTVYEVSAYQFCEYLKYI